MEIFRFLILSTIFFVFSKSGWVDPDTSLASQSTTSLVDGKEHHLVFSDEFEQDGRTFKDGEDPRWTAIHKNDYTNYALHFYNSNLAKTSGGKLNISAIVEDVTFPVHSVEKKNVKFETKNYQSAMIQGWDKFCFTGGILEVSAKLPGKWNVGGLWPAMWLLGNLARATYVGSSNNMWPWSYDTCNSGLQTQQEISACNKINHYSMQSKKGRGAPEIDLLEAMPGYGQLPNTPIHRPYFSTSLQISPSVDGYRPVNVELPDLSQWYHTDLHYGKNSSLNNFFYGMHLEGSSPIKSYSADAISANTNLSSTHFNSFHTYRLEWKTKKEKKNMKTTSTIKKEREGELKEEEEEEEDVGYLNWYLDGEFLYSITSRTLNLTGGSIPEEPMYLIFNNAISSTWGFPSPCPEGCPCQCFDCRKADLGEWECGCGLPINMCSNFPNDFLIDYVRVYQSKSDPSQLVGCSPPSHPTRRFIQAHKERYMEAPPVGSDTMPLHPVVTGGGACQEDKQCGGGFGTIKNTESFDEEIEEDLGMEEKNKNKKKNEENLKIEKGTCRRKKCVCNQGYTGPHCLASSGFDDVNWDPIPSFPAFSPLFLPAPLVLLAILMLGLWLSLIYYKYKQRKSEREQSASNEISLEGQDGEGLMMMRMEGTEGSRQQRSSGDGGRGGYTSIPT